MIQMPATSIGARPDGKFTDDEILALINSGGSQAPAPPAATRPPIAGVTPADVTGPAAPSEANAYGALEPGNMDLSMRPHVKNPDGSISTVRSLGFKDDDGKEVLIPTVNDRGFIMSDDEAIQEYRRTGRHLGKFGSVEASNAAAEAIHRDQESKMPRKLTVADDDLLNPESGPALATAAASATPEQPADPMDALIAEESGRMDEEAQAESQRDLLTQLYAKRAEEPQDTGPGDRERIYRQTHGRPEGWRRILAGIGGALAGRGDGGHRVGAAQDAYDAGLAAAMNADLEERRKGGYVDQATAQILMKYYGLDAETAANVRKDSNVLGLMNNLGSIDMRKAEIEERNKDRDLQREFMERKWEEELEFRRMNSARQDETRRLGIEARKNKDKGKGGGAGGREMLEAAIDSYVSKQATGFGRQPFTLEHAKALREGNLDALKGVDPGVLEMAKGQLADARLLAKRDPTKFASANVQAGSREAGNVDAPGKTAAVKSNDVEKKKDARQWINENGRAITDALQKWNAMSNFGRTTLVKFPGKVEGIDWDKYIRDGTATEADKDAARAISALQNVITKERSGASVSVNEMTRLYNEFGQGILKNPRQMAQWLKRMKQTFDDQSANLEQTYENLWDE